MVRSPSSRNVLHSAYSYFQRFCLETPRTGVRLLQAGDERLLKLAAECKQFICHGTRH